MCTVPGMNGAEGAAVVAAVGGQNRRPRERGHHGRRQSRGRRRERRTARLGLEVLLDQPLLLLELRLLALELMSARPAAE